MEEIKHFEQKHLNKEILVLKEADPNLIKIIKDVINDYLEKNEYNTWIYVLEGDTDSYKRMIIHLMAEANGFISETYIIKDYYDGTMHMVRIGRGENLKLSRRNISHKNIVYFDRRSRSYLKYRTKEKIAPIFHKLTQNELDEKKRLNEIERRKSKNHRKKQKRKLTKQQKIN